MFKLIRRFLLILIILMFITVSAFIAVGFYNYKEVIKEVGIENKVEQMRRDENYINFDAVSNNFTNAVVSIEDHRFYEHKGIDYISLIRATITNLVAQDLLEGGSTITQQLAKNMYFDNTPSFTRKISEAFIANDLERLYSKDEILELYINCIYYGDGFYGIKQASEGYFSVAPNLLTVEQASMLAGLPQAPSLYALSTNYEDAQKRQVDVLNAMLEYNHITKEEYKKALINEVR